MNKRRFIAGATCPECSEIDKIYVEKGVEPETRHCVSCGFSDARPTDQGSKPVGMWEPVKLTGGNSSNE